MAIIRVKHNNFEEIQNAIIGNESDLIEWSDVGRLNEPGWENRYQYESNLICDIIEENKFKNILEIGSGPGRLSQIIQNKINNQLNYHLIDKPLAEKYFRENKLKGKFFIKNIATDLDISDLNESYNLIIANDVLEHLYAPANIIKKCYHLMNDNSIFFISIPNWRMAHQFIYRGLWDYDNFIYLMYIHKFEAVDVSPSILQTPYYPKLDSEQSMPDELIQSWNFYFKFKKIK